MKTNSALGRAITALILATSSACALGGAEGPFNARVVTSDGEPIERAIVVVEWLRMEGWAHPHQERVALVETLSKSDGNIEVPDWRSLSLARRPHLMRLTIFKSGFNAKRFQEDHWSRISKAKKGFGHSWANRTLVLHRKAIEGENRAAYISELLPAVSLFRPDDPCGWKAMPNMLAALDERVRAYAAVGWQTGIPRLAEVERSTGC